MVRYFCAALGLLGLLNVNASEGPYPEVFDEFLTGWVEYDDGYYAAALRAFARAHALDPEFRPATEAMAASLGHMGMPEIGEAIVRDRWVSKGSDYDFRPAVAFWGIFHSAEIKSASTAGLEQAVTDAMNNLVDLPVVLTSPSAKTWAERKNQQPCAYNLLIFLFQEEGQEYAIARIHLIQNYSIESGKELDLALSTLPTRFAHQSVEINLDPNEIAQLSTSEAFHDGLRELFDPEIKIENPAYRIDAETEAFFTAKTIDDPWISLAKASVSTAFALDNYQAIKRFYSRYRGNGPVMAAVGPGFPEWLAHQLEIAHPMRPWLLAEADRENMSSQRWYPKKAGRIREELIRDHPDHPALIAVQLCREVWGLHHMNYQEKIPRLLLYSDKLKRLSPDLFNHPRDLEYLERFDRTMRACLGETIEEPFLPFIIYRGSQSMTRDGSFRFGFSGETPRLFEQPIHSIDDHSQFALKALIDQMSRITDTKILLSTYKEHVDREDALGVYLRRIKNGVMWRFKCGPKETYREACEWWIQRAVDMIESGAPWSEVSRTLPSYLAFNDYNQPMLKAMNRRLEQRGLLPVDENASLARSCTIKWKISFRDLSRKSREVVIQYYRERATRDLEGYFALLAWLHRSDAKQILRAEVRQAQAAYNHNLNAESDRMKRVELASKYGHLLVAAGEPQMALDVCEYVFPDLVVFEGAENDYKLWTAYTLLTIRIKALAGVDRKDEAIQEIDRIIQEIDGQFMKFRRYYIYDQNKKPRDHSLSSMLLELKAAIQQKESGLSPQRR